MQFLIIPLYMPLFTAIIANNIYIHFNSKIKLSDENHPNHLKTQQAETHKKKIERITVIINKQPLTGRHHYAKRTLCATIGVPHAPPRANACAVTETSCAAAGYHLLPRFNPKTPQKLATRQIQHESDENHTEKCQILPSRKFGCCELLL